MDFRENQRQRTQTAGADLNLPAAVHVRTLGSATSRKYENNSIKQDRRHLGSVPDQGTHSAGPRPSCNQGTRSYNALTSPQERGAPHLAAPVWGVCVSRAWLLSRLSG